MYSPWQSAWRSACVAGLAILVFACIQAFGIIRSDIASPLIGVLAVALIVGILTLVIAVAFRCGLHLSGSGKVRPATAVATAVIYPAFLAFFMSAPVEARAVAFDLPTSTQTHHALLLVPTGTLLLAFFVLPLLVSYGVSRFTRGRAESPTRR